MPGTFIVKASQNPFIAGESRAARLDALPSGMAGTRLLKHWIALDYRDADLNLPMAGTEYEIHFKDGSQLSGALDAQGKVRHDDVPDKPVEKVVYKPRPPEVEEPYPPLEELLTS